MAITRTSKGTAQNKTSQTSWTALTAVAIAAGASLIVCIVYDDDGGLTSGVTWNGLALAKNVELAALGIRGEIWSRHGNTAATGDVVVSFSPAGLAKALCAVEVAGTPQIGALDKTKTASGTSTAPNSTATVATTSADEYLQGFVGTEGPDGDVAGTWGSDTATAGQRLGTTGGATLSNVTVSEGYGIQTATGARTSSKSGITSRDWICLIATYKAGGQTFTQSLSGSLPLAASGGKQTNLQKSGLLGLAGAQGKQMNRALSGSLAVAGAFTKAGQAIRSATLSMAGAAVSTVKTSFLTLTGSLPVAGTMTRRVNQAVSATLSVAGVATKSVSRAISGAFAFSASVTKATQRVLSGSLVESGVTGKQTNRVITSTLSVAGSASRSVQRGLSAALGLGGNLTRRLSRLISGALSFVSSLTSAVPSTKPIELDGVDFLQRQADSVNFTTLAVTDALDFSVVVATKFDFATRQTDSVDFGVLNRDSVDF